MISDILEQARSKMDKAVQALRQELNGVRAGRASAGLLERVRADYYGNPTPVQQLATISTPDARTLLIQPWDKNAVGPIEKAIQKSDLGLSPQTEAGVIRLNLPQLTASRRAELIKHVRRLGEEQRVAVRGFRREAREQMERAEKAGQAGSDAVRRGLDDLQKQTDRAVEQIGQLLDTKEKEIGEV